MARSSDMGESEPDTSSSGAIMVHFLLATTLGPQVHGELPMVFVLVYLVCRSPWVVGIVVCSLVGLVGAVQD